MFSGTEAWPAEPDTLRHIMLLTTTTDRVLMDNSKNDISVLQSFLDALWPHYLLTAKTIRKQSRVQ